MSKENKKKIVFEQEIKCPNCRKHITVKKTKVMISEGIAAEYDEKITTELSKQTRLKDYKKKKKSRKKK